MNLRPGALRRTVVIVLAAVAINLAISWARGWSVPEPWWQAPAFVVAVTVVLYRAWAPYGRGDSTAVNQKPIG